MGFASFTLTGDKRLDELFQKLPKKMQKSILRKALRPATKLIHQDARQRIPEVSGQGAASLKVKAGKRSRKSPMSVSLRVITEGGFFTGKGFYLSFVEFGWKLGSRKTYDTKAGPRHKLGKRYIKERRPIEGKHYMKQAFDAQSGAAKALAIEGIQAGIDREAKAIVGSIVG